MSLLPTRGSFFCMSILAWYLEQSRGLHLQALSSNCLQGSEHAENATMAINSIISGIEFLVTILPLLVEPEAFIPDAPG